MTPLIPLDVLLRALIVPLVPSLIRLHDEEEDRPTVVVSRLPGKF
jgi:hypothetical protein